MNLIQIIIQNLIHAFKKQMNMYMELQNLSEKLIIGFFKEIKQKLS